MTSAEEIMDDAEEIIINSFYGPFGNAQDSAQTFAAAFFDMASERVEAKVCLPEGRGPTVLDWRIAISRTNRARAPTYRWLFLADPDTFELFPNDRVLVFTNSAGQVLNQPGMSGWGGDFQIQWALGRKDFSRCKNNILYYSHECCVSFYHGVR